MAAPLSDATTPCTRRAIRIAKEVSEDGSEEAEEEEEEDGEEESSGELVPVVGSARPFALKQTSLHRAPTKASPPHVELLAVTPVSFSMP